MIKILMKKQLKQLFSGFFVDRKTGKSKSKGAAVFGIVIYIALILGCMGSMFGSVAYSMCAQLCAVGLGLESYQVVLDDSVDLYQVNSVLVDGVEHKVDKTE